MSDENLRQHCEKLASNTMPKLVGCTAQLIWSRPREAVAVVRDAIYNAAAPLRQMNQVLGKELVRLRAELKDVDAAREHHFCMVRQREYELGHSEEKRKQLLAELAERDRQVKGLVEDNYRLMERANRAEAELDEVEADRDALLERANRAEALRERAEIAEAQVLETAKELECSDKARGHHFRIVLKRNSELHDLEMKLDHAKEENRRLATQVGQVLTVRDRMQEELDYALAGKTAQANVIADYQKRFRTTRSTILAVQGLLDKDMYRAARNALSALLRDLDERYYAESPNTPDSFYRAVQGALRLLGMNDHAGATAVLAGLIGDRYDG